MTPSASRSLTEPSGLNASILTNRFTSGGASLPIRTTGVLPTVSRIFANLRPMAFPPKAGKPFVACRGGDYAGADQFPQEQRPDLRLARSANSPACCLPDLFAIRHPGLEQ